MRVHVQHGTLRKAAEGLVGGLYCKVCATLHRREGEGGVKAQVCSVRFIHYQCYAPLVTHLH